MALNIAVIAHGNVGTVEVEEARRRVSALEQAIATRILGARIVLTHESNPRIGQPARADGELRLPGRTIHARVRAATMTRAVHDLVKRLEASAHRFAERIVSRKRRPSEPSAGEWYHGAWSEPRPSYFPRPPAEREIIRRKAFVAGALREADAAADLAALDHDFFLFEDADTGSDAVLYRRDDGHLAIIEPPGAAPPFDGAPLREVSRFSTPIALQTAVEEMAALNHRFLFFVQRGSERGAVIYRRYDGHYGLIELTA